MMRFLADVKFCQLIFGKKWGKLLFSLKKSDMTNFVFLGKQKINCI
jgi:hypothetical protein